MATVPGETPDLTDTAELILGISRADEDAQGQTAAVRDAQNRGHISGREVAEKLVLIREWHLAEIVRLRNRYDAAKAAKS